ncbi:hypothetical protein Tco_0690766 [Tanacetum coccineum]
MGTILCLCDPTSSDWCKIDVHSMDTGLKIQINILRIFSTWEDLTTHFLAYMESYQRLLQNFPQHGIDLWHQIQIFYDHVSFLLKCEIDHAASGKLHDKNTEESWEIIENLVLYDYKSWDD